MDCACDPANDVKCAAHVELPAGKPFELLLAADDRISYAFRTKLTEDEAWENLVSLVVSCYLGGSIGIEDGAEMLGTSKVEAARLFQHFEQAIAEDEG